MAKRVFLDTNIFVRFLTSDNEELKELAQEIIKYADMGLVKPYTSSVVIMELQYVLTKLYNFNKVRVARDLSELLTLRNLNLKEKGDTKKAIEYFSKHNIKFGDCYIATQVPKGVTLVSFDIKHFKKFKGLQVASPKQFLSQLDKTI